MKKEKINEVDGLDELGLKALTGWVKKQGDEIQAVESWLKFRKRHTSWQNSRIWCQIAGCVGAACVAVLVTLSIVKNPLGCYENYETFVVPSGQRAQLLMSDGTVVWLNSNTTLKYPCVFSGSERLVTLDGEAYFEVARDEKRPFVVSTSRTDVKVLGTRFNVNDYSHMETCSVSLLEGKVEIAPKDSDFSRIVLKPDERLSYKGGHWIKDVHASEDQILWKKGIYAFDDCSFKEITNSLEMYFDVRIVNRNNAFSNQRFSGKFRQMDGVESLLRNLQELYSFKYTLDKDNNTITIY